MSNPEIEDVLSSIRRLVSEDLRPAARPTASAPIAEDKLLLTPALRVVEPQPQQAEPAPTTAFAAPVLTEAAPGDPAAVPPPVEEVVSRLGAAVAEDDWESPFGDPEVWQTHEIEEGVPTFVHRARPVIEDELPPAFTDAPMASFAPFEEVVAEDMGAEQSHAPAYDAGYDLGFDETDAEPQPAAEPRAAPRQVSLPAEDDAWADAAEAAAIADLARAAEEDVISSLQDRAQGGMTFDEEILRDLVRDIIREELSGSLGERITRNVRKLVRAEIARALALRDFE